METPDAILIAGIISISIGLIKILEKIIENQVPKLRRNGGFSGSDREKLNMLSTLHDKYDADGLPLWYVPRKWAKVQDSILKELTEQTVILKQFVGKGDGR